MASQRGREPADGDDAPAARESYGWLATSAVPAKKRRTIEGAPRARAALGRGGRMRGCGTRLRRPPAAAARSCSRRKRHQGTRHPRARPPLQPPAGPRL
jgi:hypothetical protein